MATISESQANQILKAAGIDPNSLSFQDKIDMAHALNFANGQPVQDALAGKNAGYATSIAYRAGDGKNSPGAQAIYAYLAKQMSPAVAAQAANPANAWQGKSHNFFVENPWAAPIAEIGTALIPGVGPEAAAAIDAAIGGISHANIGSGAPNPSNPLTGALEGAATGYGANKIAGSLGLGGGSGDDLPPELDPTSPDYNPGALDPSSPTFDPALAQELEKNPGLLTGGGGGSASLAALAGGGGGGLSAVDMARLGLAGLDAVNATQEAGKADTLRTKALSGVSATPSIGPLPAPPSSPYRSPMSSVAAPGPTLPPALPPGGPVTALPPNPIGTITATNLQPQASPWAKPPLPPMPPSPVTPPTPSSPAPAGRLSLADLLNQLKLGGGSAATAGLGAKLPLLTLLGSH